ncbi:MAG: hypothetical protein DME59_08270 [Verrucomicrobia bacterium]|nr:MAG: hypothetical protein DME59_08270 [Verrucomicrobiota bacterium]
MNLPLSLSGVEIDGQSPVRFVYADESGISANETILVVAGVIIHADSKWIPTEQRIRALIDKYVPEVDRPRDFVFRASDLFHGTRAFKDRQKYPLERRLQALRDILSIPSQIRLPVVFGWTRKDRTFGESKKQRRAEVAFEHAHALSLCVIGAERFMRGWAAPFELATLTVEDNTETKATVKVMHDAFRGVGHPGLLKWAKQYPQDVEGTADFLPLRKIVDGVHFVGKSGAFLLQLADACAWIIRCYLEEKPGMEGLLSAFVPRGPHAIETLDNVRGHFAGGSAVRCWDKLA